MMVFVNHRQACIGVLVSSIIPFIQACSFCAAIYRIIAPMQQHLAHIALVVKDYDEAIAFYTQKLHFRLVEDTKLSEEKRWVLVAPPGDSKCCLLLAKAANERQLTSVGNQTGGRVFLFLFTDDFWRNYKTMQQKGIKFVRPAVEEPHGTVAVFEDLYGNLWDFIQPSKRT